MDNINKKNCTNNTYFNLNDDFEKIIKTTLSDKKILNLNQIPTGWTNIVYEVETNDGNFFFRFPRDEFWSRTIVKDYEFSKYIYNKTDFDTVKLKLFYDNSRPFSVHKKIPGTPLAEKMNNLDSNEIKNISGDISKFMYQLHCLDFDKSQIFETTNIGLELPDFLNELLNVHVDKKDMNFWDPSSLSSNENCLVHGDLNSSNILLNEDNKVTAIIDFGFGGFGNKYNDIGRIIGRCPDTFKNEIIKSYEAYSNAKLDNNFLDSNIKIWSNIDNSYINYMRKIGIYD